MEMGPSKDVKQRPAGWLGDFELCWFCGTQNHKRWPTCSVRLGKRKRNLRNMKNWKETFGARGPRNTNSFLKRNLNRHRGKWRKSPCIFISHHTDYDHHLKIIEPTIGWNKTILNISHRMWKTGFQEIQHPIISARRAGMIFARKRGHEGSNFWKRWWSPSGYWFTEVTCRVTKGSWSSQSHARIRTVQSLSVI